MNGFISKQTVRRTLVFTTCLSLGFFTGLNFNGVDQLPDLAKLNLSLNGINSVFANISAINENSDNGEYSVSGLFSKHVSLEDFTHPNRKKEFSSKLKIKTQQDELDLILAEASRLETIQENQNLLLKMRERFSAAVLSNESIALNPSSAVADIKVIEEATSDIRSIPELRAISLLVNESNQKLLRQNLNNQQLSTQILNEKIAAKTDTHQESIKVASVKMNRSSFSLSDCNLTPKLKLLKPVEAPKGEDSHVCPMHKSWISKNWNDEGWVKVETESYFPVLVHYPQPSSESVLLMDQNSVALMAIKSGLHYSRGTGMILGSVPQNYKIDFSGRSEDIQYFEFKGTKYFFILNVDLGANVVELVSEKNPTEIATVFTPVIEDTVTFLDLSSPTLTDLKVKVVKSGDKENSSISGLTVSLSTQTLFQSQTDTDGYSILKKVPVVIGYPLFVDVSSKLNGEKSYQYRYELTKKQKDDSYHLKQYAEKNLSHWLKQVKTKLTEQNGMLVGEYDRKKLDGFKNHRFIRTDPITEKYTNKTRTYAVLWDEQLSEVDPLEGDHPKFISVQVPEGLLQAKVVDESKEVIHSSLIPVSPRVINVLSE